MLVVCAGLILVRTTFDLGDSAHKPGLALGNTLGLCSRGLGRANAIPVCELNAVQVACGRNLDHSDVLLPFRCGKRLRIMAPMTGCGALAGLFCTGLAHGLFVASLSVLRHASLAVLCSGRVYASFSPGTCLLNNPLAHCCWADVADRSALALVRRAPKPLEVMGLAIALRASGAGFRSTLTQLVMTPSWPLDRLQGTPVTGQASNTPHAITNPR